MRKFVIMRGPQGSGKSTFLRHAGLENHTLSPDSVRKLLNAPLMREDGLFEVAQHRGREVWALCDQILQSRMQDGETIAFDATLPRVKDVEALIAKAKSWRYKVLVVDFYPVGLERAKAQNATRAEPHYVPERAIVETFGCYVPYTGTDADVVLWSEDGAHLRAIKEFLDVPKIDISAYDRVIHVGDLQGCASVLFDHNSPLANGLDPKNFYVFTGDFLDRGIENYEAMRFGLSLVGLPNVALIGGNHETHLERWVDGRECVSREFIKRTLPQLEAGGLASEDVGVFVDSLIEVFPYVWRGVDVLACHAGLPMWPKDLWRISTKQWRNGTGRYESPVDADFSAWAQGRHVFQVHGHRNTEILPVLASSYSFNLESQVEFGGHMCFLTLDSNGFSGLKIRNTLYRGAKEWYMIDRLEKTKWNRLPVPSWVGGEVLEPAIDKNNFDNFIAHQNVHVKPSLTLPHVSALNFDRDAFCSGVWDEFTLRARGLFVDTLTRRVVARSYPKFFNWGERSETEPSALMARLKFPVVGYLKENGYLGITGYDRTTDRLIVASKSTIEGSFAENFDRILRKSLGENGIERLTRYLRDTGSSAVFEVIDPVNDPHIVEYTEEGIVLLDIVERSEHFRTLEYDQLTKVGSVLGIPTKERSIIFKNWEALERFLQNPLNDRDWNWKGKFVEGFVFADSNNEQFKIKTAWYVFWKQMRTVARRVGKIRGTKRSLGLHIEDPLAEQFYQFCLGTPDEDLAKGIVWLRNRFLDNSTPTGISPVVFEDRALTSFRAMLDNVGPLVSKGKVKAETIEKILEQLLDVKKKEIFDAHPFKEEFLNF